MNHTGRNQHPPIAGPPMRNPAYAAAKPRRTTYMNLNLALWLDFCAVAASQGMSAPRAISLLMEGWIEQVRAAVAQREAQQSAEVPGHG